MSTHIDSKYSDAPVAIGGVGGSGTRLIAQILKELGFYVGSDLNDANDNLWFTLLFKRREVLAESGEQFSQLVDIFLEGMAGDKNFSIAQVKLIKKLSLIDRPQHPVEWLRKRADSLLAKQDNQEKVKYWGWKEPNTHVVINRLQKALPDIKYIHVVRNGLDMAHSANQNQLKLWGSHFIGADYEISPYYSLKYWSIVHRRVLELGESMGARFFLLNYDQFCLDPTNSLKKLCGFLEVDISNSQISDLSQLIKVPNSIGRFKQFGLDIFDPADVDFVRQFGFDTEN